MDSKATLAELVAAHVGLHRSQGSGALGQRRPSSSAFAHGLALMVIVYAWGSVPGTM